MYFLKIQKVLYFFNRFNREMIVTEISRFKQNKFIKDLNTFFNKPI